MDTLTDLGGAVLAPLYHATSAVLVGWYHLLTDVVGLDGDGGAAWLLSIVGLTLVVRTALVPLFVRQIKASRSMQLLQPKIAALREEHGDDRERLAQETMALYRESGTNPFASCLPLLVQAPIFLALFRLVDQAAKHGTGHGLLSDALAQRFGDAELLGRLPISATFLHPQGMLGVQVVAAVLVAAMTATTFLTQRQLMSKNMPEDAMAGPFAQQQKTLLLVLPLVFAVGGVAFPVGVLVYWTTSNLWTMGQQFFVIHTNPAPGTPAMRAKEARDRAGAGRGRPVPGWRRAVRELVRLVRTAFAAR